MGGGEGEPIKVEISRVFRASMKEVFDWCTDFTEDDPQLAGQIGSRRIVLERGLDKVVYKGLKEKGGRILTSISTVWLYPPNRWRLEHRGDEWDENGEYLLTSEGDKTRLTMKFEMWPKGERRNEPPEKLRAEQERIINGIWNNYLEAFHKEREEG